MKDKQTQGFLTQLLLPFQKLLYFFLVWVIVINGTLAHVQGP